MLIYNFIDILKNEPMYKYKIYILLISVNLLLMDTTFYLVSI